MRTRRDAMRSLMRGLTLTVLLPTLSAAQQIRGVVVEDSTFRPISDVKIELLAADRTVLATSTSDAVGWFTLNAQGGGEFTLQASHDAYTNMDILTVVLGPQQTLTVLLRLSGGPIPIAPVIASAKIRDRLSDYRDRARKGVYGRFITREDIDKRGAYNLSHVLRFTPEVRIERVRDGAFTSDGVFMRSFGDLCVPSVYLDGIQVPTGLTFDIDALISAEAVEGIEVYRSSLTAPMEFRMPAFGGPDLCGVIAVWSRPMPGVGLTLKRVVYAGLLVAVPIWFMRLLETY